MNDPYFVILKEIYSSSGVTTVLTDGNFKIQWINDEELLKKYEAKSALCFFEEGSSIPTSSGKYRGILNGAAYNHNVILCKNPEHTLFIIELLHPDTLVETMSNPSVTHYLSNFDAGIRQAVFSISGSASNLYDVLEATESYNEINFVNTQMRECYKILKAIQVPNEILKYIYNVMDIKVIDLSRFFNATRETFSHILQEKKACLTVETEPGLYIKADEERLRYMLLDMILYTIKHSQGLPCAKIVAERVAQDILISVSPGEEVPELLLSLFTSYSPGGSWTGTSSIYAEEMDLYIVRQFCERFDGKLYTVTGKDGETAVGVRLPFAAVGEYASLNSPLQSGLEEYQADKFSPFHIGLADIYSFNFFDQI